MLKIKCILFIFTTSIFICNSHAYSKDFQIYSVFNPLFLGDDNTQPVKDFYINAGKIHGIKKGSSLKIYRKISSFDMLQRKHHQDLIVPVGSVKVIHVDTKASIARTEKFLPMEENAALTAHHFQVGDLVRMD